MELLRITVPLLLVVLGQGDCFYHFPGRFNSPVAQENTLSPIGANSNRGASMKDWLKVSGGEGVLRLARGETLQLDCEAIGSPAPRLQWFKGSHPVTQMTDEDNTIRGFGLAKVTRRLVVDCVVEGHEGSYTCSAIAGGESADSSTTQVIVDGGSERECQAGGPKIVFWAQIVMQTMGSEVKIPCLAHAADSLRWISKDGMVISNTPGSRLKALRNGDLVISKLRWTDMGTYTCVAENALGKDSVTTFLYPMLNED